MKRCPRCARTFPDDLSFCVDDASPLDATATRTLADERRPGGLAPVVALAHITSLADALAAARRLAAPTLSPADIELDGDRVRLTLSVDAAPTPAPDAPDPHAAYTAPERLADGAPASEAATVYNLGALLWELLTGVTPFDGTTATRAAVAVRKLLEDAPSARALAPAVPVDLDALVRAAMDRDPARRPADVSSFAASLRALPPPAPARSPAAPPLAAAPVPAPSSPPALASSAPRARTGRVWFAGALALFAAAAALAVLPRAAVRHDDAPSSSPAPSAPAPRVEPQSAAPTLAAPTPVAPVAPVAPATPTPQRAPVVRSRPGSFGTERSRMAPHTRAGDVPPRPSRTPLAHGTGATAGRTAPTVMGGSFGTEPSEGEGASDSLTTPTLPGGIVSVGPPVDLDAPAARPLSRRRPRRPAPPSVNAPPVHAPTTEPATVAPPASNTGASVDARPTTAPPAPPLPTPVERSQPTVVRAPAERTDPRLVAALAAMVLGAVAVAVGALRMRRRPVAVTERTGATAPPETLVRTLPPTVQARAWRGTHDGHDTVVDEAMAATVQAPMPPPGSAVWCRQCGLACPSEARFCPNDGAALAREGSTVDPHPRPARAADVQPFEVGAWRCEARLGEGGMGVVYRARNGADGRVAAVKVLLAGGRAERGMAERFRREARLAASIRHPNSVAIYDYGELDGRMFFLAMELIEGESLDGLLGESALPWPRAVAIVRQVCAALAAVHAAGIVHRDLKPANVMVTVRPDGTEHAKLVDFGIARDLGGHGERTLAGVVVGTPAYMAPEQARAEPGVDARADVFALAVMTWEMLAGRAPWEPQGNAIQQIVARAMLKSEAPAVSVAAPGVPSTFDAVLVRAAAPSVEARTPSVTRFAEELHEAASQGASARVGEARAAP